MLNYYFNRIQEAFFYQKGKYFQDQLFVQNERATRCIPFFILSAGRSGSTLLRKLLMEKAKVHIPPESYDCIPKSIFYFIKNQNLEWHTKVQHILKIFQEDESFKFWDIDLNKNINELYEISEEYRNYNKIIDYIYEQHCIKIHNEKLPFGDKTPYLGLRINWLKLAYPSSKYLFLIRDPVYIVRSRTKHFNEDLLASVMRVIWTMNGFAKYSNNMDFRIIKYEDIIKNTDQEVSEIIQYLNLSKREFEINVDERSLGDSKQIHHINLLQKKVTNENLKYDKDNDIKELNFIRQTLTSKLSNKTKEIFEFENITYH